MFVTCLFSHIFSRLTNASTTRQHTNCQLRTTTGSCRSEPVSCTESAEDFTDNKTADLQTDFTSLAAGHAQCNPLKTQSPSPAKWSVYGTHACPSHSHGLNALNVSAEHTLRRHRCLSRRSRGNSRQLVPMFAVTCCHDPEPPAIAALSVCAHSCLRRCPASSKSGRRSLLVLLHLSHYAAHTAALQDCQLYRTDLHTAIHSVQMCNYGESQ